LRVLCFVHVEGGNLTEIVSNCSMSFPRPGVILVETVLYLPWLFDWFKRTL